MKISTKLSVLTLGFSILLSTQVIAQDESLQNTFIHPKYNTDNAISKSLGIERAYIQVVTCQAPNAGGQLKNGTRCNDGTCDITGNACANNGGVSPGHTPTQKDNII